MKFRSLVQKAVDIKGSQQKLAEALDCSQQQISYLLNEAENISAEMAIKLEIATAGAVRSSDLRPDLFPKASAHRAGAAA